MKKFLILLVGVILALYSTETRREIMHKIVISKFNEKHSVTYAIYDVVELLKKENVPVEDINRDAYISYMITTSFRDFRYGGYSSFLHEIKCNAKLEKQIINQLEKIKAFKHLDYMKRQKKVFDSLSTEEKNQFLEKYVGRIGKSLYTKVSGNGFKTIFKEENLNELHVTWLKNQSWLEVASFDEKYKNISHIVGRDMMPIVQKDKDIYQYLLEREKNKKFFDLERLYSVAVYGEIEKFYWKEWAPDATKPNTIKDEFYSFAVDGAGGNYLLWYYDGLKKDAPVVYFSSEGESKYLASSFSAYIENFPSAFDDEDLNNTLHKLKKFKLTENEKYNLYDIFEDYNKELADKLSSKEMAKLLQEEIEDYISETKKKFSYALYDEKKEKERFELLVKQLEGNMGIFDYIKAYIEIYKHFSSISK